MKTTLDNAQRVFLFTGENSKVFCNLHDVPNALKSFDNLDEVQMFEFWNFRLKKLSKKSLNVLFEGNQMKNRIV